MKLSLITLLAVLLASPAGAIVISNPLSLQTQYLAGILNGQPGPTNATIEQGYAQTILDLGLGQTTGSPPNTFQANTLFDYSGTITFNGGQSTLGIDGDATVSIPAGWGGALVKYDGDNAGYVLFLFGGEASTIPEYPWNLWTDNTTKYQISHYTLFRGTGDVTITPTAVVPEGGVPMALFGLVLTGIGLMHRKLGKFRSA
jgi:hypothetical protein